ncbi:hypothetical protein MCOL_V201775 [Mycobacterium colombiense CECT 3035]|uniref:CD-NTase-associated protein 12/Pycsar effector protein TIR domain-containing protein n=2 Tax=Mycobacterium colombiense TaxID=339268 RepID=J4TLQ6_9MYCO|nr:hypothetical protein MCOL_V201775 [Mycobacterium colombiense CECT 3035]
MGAFLRRYDQNKLPKEMIGRNVLEEMGVPAEQTQRAFNAIVESGRAVGFIYEHRGGEYVDLNRVSMPGAASEPDEAIEERGGDGGGGGDTALADIVDITGAGAITDRTPTPPPVKVEEVVNNRVFVTHGKNRAVVEQLKELLTYGGFVPVVSVEKETLAKSIPDKVLDDMRSCSAGIVHVGSEMVLKDDDGNEHKLLNSNVLIEIGAALALYGKRLILLVEEGTELPSNLQGLYQARYAGGELTHSATMKLLKTFNEFKSAPPA